jgi:glycosyltransferase involved in cell wall biosynthesis/SAM-dependent methyltransferase
LRIALVVHCFFPTHFYGTETYTLELARNLRDLGHEPIVVSAIFPGEPGQAAIVSRDEYQGLPVYRIDKNYCPDTRIKDTYYQPGLRDVLLDLLRDISPDIVHVTHLINHTAVLLEVTRALGVPTVATFTDFFGFCYNNRLETVEGRLCRGPSRSRANCLACHLKAAAHRRADLLGRVARRPLGARAGAIVLRVLTRVPRFRRGRLAGIVEDIAQRPDTLGALYRNYAAAIAPTRFLRDRYLANGLSVPMHEIRFGVDLPRSPKPARPSDAPITFGFVGQIAPHKGTDILLEAFRGIDASRGRLLVYGPDTHDVFMASLRRLASGHPVTFCGTFPRQDFARVLSEIDFLAIPSRWSENSPLVLLSALATHTPVVISDAPGMTEFVEPQTNGYIFESGNTRALKRVLEDIVYDRGPALALPRTTEYARTTRTMTLDTIAVYEEVLGQRRSLVTAAGWRRPDYELGCQLPLEEWLWLNRVGAFESPALRRYVSPFPPIELMRNVSGLSSERDFASHGSDLFAALTEASDRPLSAYKRVLDFGCGCGRLARMFKGHPHEVHGCDIDKRHVKWIDENLDHMVAAVSRPTPPLPYASGLFDVIIAISVFTHLTEQSEQLFLGELHRIAAAAGRLFLTVHGARALERALSEKAILSMLNVPRSALEAARERFETGQHAFILQRGHLTTGGKVRANRAAVIEEPYEYGITFVPEAHVLTRWSKWFTVLDHHSGAIHDFQDIVVLAPKEGIDTPDIRAAATASAGA